MPEPIHDDAPALNDAIQKAHFAGEPGAVFANRCYTLATRLLRIIPVDFINCRITIAGDYVLGPLRSGAPLTFVRCHLTALHPFTPWALDEQGEPQALPVIDAGQLSGQNLEAAVRKLEETEAPAAVKKAEPAAEGKIGASLLIRTLSKPIGDMPTNARVWRPLAKPFDFAYGRKGWVKREGEKVGVLYEGADAVIQYDEEDVFTYVAYE